MSIGMSTAMDVNEFDYVDLRTVDPNYTAIEDDVYEIKVVRTKLGKTTGANGKEIKPFASITVAVTNHAKYNGRRLSKTFWNIQDAGSRDMKDLRKLSDVTGVQFTSTFPAWLEELAQVGPIFRTKVYQQDERDFKAPKDAEGKYPVKVNADGTPVKENVIDFRNAQPV